MTRKGVFLLGGALALVGALVVGIPALLRARITSGESPPIGDTRSLHSAQAAYQSANGGFFEGRLECLSTPSLCIPGYGANDPTFLDPYLASLRTKSGYKRFFYQGPPADPKEIDRRLDALEENKAKSRPWSAVKKSILKTQRARARRKALSRS